MRPLKILLLLNYLGFASFSAAIITPALPQIEKSFQLAHGALEWMVSIYLIGSLAGQLIHGPLANRFGRIAALRIGMWVNLLGTLICLAASQTNMYSLLLAGRLITALGASAGLTCGFILINELLSVQQARQTLSYAVIAITVGIGLAVTVGGIITEYTHWQFCFGILLIYGIAMSVQTGQFSETLKQARPLNPRTIWESYQSALKCGPLVIFSLTVGILSACNYCYSASAPIYAHTVLGLSPDQYGYWNIMSMIGMLSSGLVSVRLMRLYAPRTIIFASFVPIAFCLLALIYLIYSPQSQPIWYFGVIFCLFLFAGLLFSPASYIASNAIDDRATASGLMTFFNLCSATGAVIVMGYLPLHTLTAFTTVLVTLFSLVVLANILLYSREHSHTNASPPTGV